MKQSNLPEGWAYEPADPDVGIMQAVVYHDACPTPTGNGDDVRGEVSRIDSTPMPGGGKQIREWQRFTCPDCGATVEVDWGYDYEPPDEVEAL